MTKMKTVDSVRYGPHDIDCWYFAPYPINPQEAGRTLFVCAQEGRRRLGVGSQTHSPASALLHFSSPGKNVPCNRFSVGDGLPWRAAGEGLGGVARPGPEYCLKYMVSAGALERHYAQCLYRHPPGDEIYRDEANGIRYVGTSVVFFLIL